jgi:hypothetical protein
LASTAWLGSAPTKSINDSTTTLTIPCVIDAGTLAGVVGVAVTGFILDAEGGANTILGWWHAHAMCAVICTAAMFIFNMFAKGERLFD